LPLLSFEEAMVPSKLRSTPDRNSSNKTRWENDIQTSGTPGGYIGENYTSRGNHRRKPGRKQVPGCSHTKAARPGVDPRPLCVRSTRTPFPARFRLMIFHI
jgi:hypothetical protein